MTVYRLVSVFQTEREYQFVRFTSRSFRLIVALSGKELLFSFCFGTHLIDSFDHICERSFVYNRVRG